MQTAQESFQALVRDVKQQLARKNEHLFNELEGIESKLKKKRESVSIIDDKVMDELEKIFKETSIIDIFLDEETSDRYMEEEARIKKELYEKNPEFVEIKNSYDELYQEKGSIFDKIEANRVEISKQIDGAVFTVIGEHYYNGDVGDFMFDRETKIEMDGRKYWHQNVFDAGDIHGKEGCAAMHYCLGSGKNEPSCNLPTCQPYDEEDKRNIAKIEKIVDIGMLM